MNTIFSALVAMVVVSVSTHSAQAEKSVKGQYPGSDKGIAEGPHLVVAGRVGQSFVGITGESALRIHVGMMHTAQLVKAAREGHHAAPESESAESPFVPTEFRVFDNYPNPFNPKTTIRFDLPEPAHVTMRIYDLLGQEVAALAETEYHEAGSYQIRFDGSRLSSGTYFCRTMAGRYSSVKKMMLMK